MMSKPSQVSLRLAPGSELIVITGLSGSGKSTQGRDLAGFLGAAYIDQDKSFIHPRDMGTVEYKGREVPLYDQESSLDFIRLREAIAAKSFSTKKVVLVGFYLPPKVLVGLSGVQVYYFEYRSGDVHRAPKTEQGKKVGSWPAG